MGAFGIVSSRTSGDVLVALLLLAGCRRETDKVGDTSSGPSGSVAAQAPAASVYAPEPESRASAAPGGKLPAGACRDALLTGSIGTNPIVMQLRICGEAVGGRYYYRHNRESLLLFGTLKQPASGGLGQIELRELGADGQPFKPNGATFSGDVSLHDRIRVGSNEASWKQKGRTLAWAAIEHTSGETYSSLRRTAGPSKKSVDGSFSYRMVQHVWEYVLCAPEGAPPPGPIELFPDAARDFRVEDCPSGRRVPVDASWPEVLEARAGLDATSANETLASLLNDFVPSATEAAGGGTSARVVAARGRVLSFIIKTDGPFQGAYPPHTEYGVTLDLRDGRRQELSDLLDVGDAGDADDLVPVLEERVPLSPVGGGERCEWAGTELLLHITERGLHVTPDFPHVAKACQYANLGRLVPRDLAVRHARRGSLLDDVLANRWGP